MSNISFVSSYFAWFSFFFLLFSIFSSLLFSSLLQIAWNFNLVTFFSRSYLPCFIAVLGDAAAASVGRVESLIYKHAPLLFEKSPEVILPS